MLNTRYFRLKPNCSPEKVEWIEMTGKEFYYFVKSPEGQNRHFIDMGDSESCPRKIFKKFFRTNLKKVSNRESEGTK